MDILKIKNFFGNTLNVGSNNEYTIEYIAKKIYANLNNTQHEIYVPFFWRTIVITYNLIIKIKKFVRFRVGEGV